MEHEGVDIASVELSNNVIKVMYANGATETLANSADTYKAFHDKWLVSNPPFISDKFKVQMRDLTLATLTHKASSITALTKYFQSPNEANVKSFLAYMRTRPSVLPAQKAQWTSI